MREGWRTPLIPVLREAERCELLDSHGYTPTTICNSRKSNIFSAPYAPAMHYPLYRHTGQTLTYIICKRLAKASSTIRPS